MYKQTTKRRVSMLVCVQVRVCECVSKCVFSQKSINFINPPITYCACIRQKVIHHLRDTKREDKKKRSKKRQGCNKNVLLFAFWARGVVRLEFPMVHFALTNAHPPRTLTPIQLYSYDTKVPDEVQAVLPPLFRHSCRFPGLCRSTHRSFPSPTPLLGPVVMARGKLLPTKSSRPSAPPGPLRPHVMNIEEAFQAMQLKLPRGAFDFLAFYSSVLGGGIVTDPALMTVPMDEHMVHRGHAVFDTCNVSQGQCYGLDFHLDRLLRSAGQARIHPSYTKEELRQIILSTVAASQQRDGIFVRFWMTAGVFGETKGSGKQEADGWGRDIIFAGTVGRYTNLDIRSSLSLLTLSSLSHAQPHRTRQFFGQLQGNGKQWFICDGASVHIQGGAKAAGGG